MNPKDKWKMIALAVGGISGLLAGLIAAYMYIQRVEPLSDKPKFSAGEGVKIGLGVLGVLRLIAELGQQPKK